MSPKALGLSNAIRRASSSARGVRRDMASPFTEGASRRGRFARLLGGVSAIGRGELLGGSDAEEFVDFATEFQRHFDGPFSVQVVVATVLIPQIAVRTDRAKGIFAAALEARRIDTVTKYITEHTAPEDPVFVVPSRSFQAKPCRYSIPSSPR